MEWIAPWWEVTEERRDWAAAWERELRTEVGVGHPLHGLPVVAIGKNDACDDILFEVLDGSGRLAVVHLTWARHPEPLPWPLTEFFAGLEAFEELRMRPDHDEQ